ncbi:hypothetical protein JEQ12_020285 [Ovis aries]|uniref:MAGE domain-containing protein n=1 Tax=Ovis aries TaxID=9940 RepID=A0A835ZMI3_SHEEP|nr:hypothetical protein JEQ12_020285 [Ovis aries]
MGFHQSSLGVPPVFLQDLTLSPGAPGTRRPRQTSEAHVVRSESRGGPGSTRSEGIVLLVGMSKLNKPEEDLQDPGEAQGLVEVQLLGTEVQEAASPSASSSTVSSSAPREALPQEALKEMITKLMNFLLLKYRAKELTSQAEMLKKVLKDNQEHFPLVFRQASECLQLVFGVEVAGVYPRKDTYGMIPALGLTCDEMLSDGQGLPKAGLLVLVLSVIMRNGDPTPEEVVWGALSRMGVYVGRENSIFGEPRELLTQVWVGGGYLEYRQVPDSDPARYEFLWGPRAYAETSKEQVMAFVLRDHFPVVLFQAEQSLQVVFGLEVDPSEHRYVLVPTLVLTLSEMLRDGQRLPKAGFLVVILCLIIKYEDCAPEEEVWAELCRMGLCPGRKHYIFGEPRELLTHVWVREVYLEYQQVPDSDPAHYEFLWGPRAYVETSKFKIYRNSKFQRDKPLLLQDI